MCLVGRCENFALVNEVHTESLQNLSFNKVANAGLGHDRNGDRSLNAFDHVGVAHTGDSAIFSNVSGNSFECHDGASAGIFSNLCLSRSHDIHDDSAFQHLGKTTLDRERANLSIV